MFTDLALTGGFHINGGKSCQGEGQKAIPAHPTCTAKGGQPGFEGVVLNGNPFPGYVLVKGLRAEQRGLKPLKVADNRRQHYVLIEANFERFVAYVLA